MDYCSAKVSLLFEAAGVRQIMDLFHSGCSYLPQYLETSIDVYLIVQVGSAGKGQEVRGKKEL